MDNCTLRSVLDLPAPLCSIFSFRYFNSLQSECFSTCFHSDMNMVISAPTGSGKTVLFELCMMRIFSKFTSTDGKFINVKGTSKTIYVAPSKALVQEKLHDWNQKFGPMGVICLELTGDNENCNTRTIHDADIILTTLEEFDAIKDGGLSFFGDIALVLLDEVHLLSDPRGAALEAIVSRMKMLACKSEMKSSPLAHVRFLAISATIPNIDDLAERLMVPREGIKRFGEEMRLVKPTTKVLEGRTAIEQEGGILVEVGTEEDFSYVEHVKEGREGTKGKEKEVEDGEGNVMLSKMPAHNVHPSWTVRDKYRQGRRWSLFPDVEELQRAFRTVKETDKQGKKGERHAKKEAMSVVVVGWSDLFSDILAVIASHLPVEDLMAFRGVCTSWRDAGSMEMFVSKVPLLMIVEKDDSHVRFYSLSKRICMIKSIPIAQGKRCTDVGFGWIMALATSGEVILFNPFSSERIDLPNYTTFPEYEKDFIESEFCPGIHFITRGVLTANPSHTSEFNLILVIVGSCLGFWRNGDPEWTRINSRSQNVIYRCGKVYSFSWESSGWSGVEVWDLGDFSKPIDILHDKLMILPEVNTTNEPYLVESTDGELLLIFRSNDGYHFDVNVYMGADSFKVMRIDFEGRKFEQIYDLGDDAIFIGDNAAVSVDVTKNPGVIKPNCICFTDDRDRYFKSFESDSAYGLDMGIYSMPDVAEEGVPAEEKGDIERLTVRSRNREDIFTIDSRRTRAPIWVSPTIVGWLEAKKP